MPTPIGDVRIARAGLTAQGWLLDKRADSRSFRVYPGETFDVPGSRLLVVSIEKDGVLLDVDDTR